MVVNYNNKSFNNRLIVKNFDRKHTLTNDPKLYINPNTCNTYDPI